MISQVTARWYLQCIDQLVRHFGSLSYDSQFFSWILIDAFPLPDTFLDDSSPLLVRTPGENIENYSGYSFYLDMDLYRLDNRQVQHLFDDGAYNDLRSKGYSKLSYHLRAFRPAYIVGNGDTILDICKSVFHFLGQRW